MSNQIAQLEIEAKNALSILKYIIGYPQDSLLALSENLSSFDNDLISLENFQVSVENLIDYQIVDQNRALSQLSAKLGGTAANYQRMGIWGNHSPTMFPDFFHAQKDGTPVTDLASESWFKDDFLKTVSTRGKAIITARGQSSAASAASAALDHMSSWWHGTAEGDFVSMGIPSDGSYGIPENLIFSFPVTIKDGVYSIVQGIEHNAFAQAKIAATTEELQGERAAVADLLG
ncbi:MAG: hypothetical protein CMD01_04335 [Flavobacteriales bacterium]|nr:hypothetical protein [Flavobacteriales bacterium]